LGAGVAEGKRGKLYNFLVEKLIVNLKGPENLNHIQTLPAVLSHISKKMAAVSNTIFIH
jgi:hypothetical protein